MKRYNEDYRKRDCSIVNKILFGISCHGFGFILFLLVTCPNYGQVLQKKPVTESDYHLWGTLHVDKISDKGKWVSYYMHYEEESDTLFVKRSDAKKTYAFPKSTYGTFCGERAFASLKNNGNLQWLDLEEGNIKVIEEVEKYLFSDNGNYLITLEGKEEQKKVCIRNNKGQVIETILGVSNYVANNNNSAIVCTYDSGEKSGILWVELGKNIQTKSIVEDVSAKFSHLVWHNKGEGFVALKKNEGTEGSVVFYYNLKMNKGYSFDSSQSTEFPSNYFVEEGYATGLTVSSDGTKVFFLIRKKPAFAKSFNGIQQWNGKDAMVYPEKQLKGDVMFNTRVVAWWPQSGKLRLITDQDKPFVFLNGNQNFAVTFSQSDLPPQYKMNRNVNYYVTDLETGERNLIVENQSTNFTEFSFSPNGKYFAYFKENNWWVYNFLTQKHFNATLGKSLQVVNDDDKSQKSVYDVVGWSNSDDYLLLTDAFDIWKISVVDGKMQRLTKGKEARISYSIVPSDYSQHLPSVFSGYIGAQVDTNRPIMLRGTQGITMGYFMLEPNSKLKTIVFGNYKVAEITKATQVNVYLFQKTQYNNPSELVINKGSIKTVFSLFKSNSHTDKFAWGKQEMIYYTNTKKVPLQGILYYPANYNPKEKYPMVVRIYEKQSDMFHNYYNPSLHNMTGYNIANLTAKGYFVLLPDIIYEKGNPGISAADCVIAATKEVINKGIINPNKIGLMGNSFGGYETNFIIGQTNLFACAVSGASVADITGWYLSIGWMSGLPEIWRFEDQQWRMGKSLFEDKKAYENNSPITYVDNIKTPVLIWTGEEDRQVHYYQSIAFYLALRRLKKEVIMMIYPEESHALLKKENQKDLTHRVEDWLGYYLKDESPKNWIKEGI